MKFVILFLLPLAACSQGGVTLASSCAGASDALCNPYAYAEATSATLTPAGLRPGELSATAQLHVDLHTCMSMSPRHTVILKARATATSPLADGGASDRIYILATVSDDGMHGDAHADDGIIDAIIANPFDTNIPGNATIELSVTPHAEPHCDGPPLTFSYLTGPTCSFVPPMSCASTP